MSPSNERVAKGNGNKPTYYQPRNRNESERLEVQHKMIGALFGWQIHPKLSSLPNIQNVLDVATGTATWLRDAHASFPSARLNGVDLSADQLPEPVPGFMSQLFTHNAIEPFPSEHLGTYDIVHQRFLVLALTRAQWAVEIPNILALLKPGGWAQIVEFDVLVDESDLSSDTARILQKTLFAVAQANDMNFRLSSDIASKLFEAGFINVATETRPIRVGKGSNLPPDLQEPAISRWLGGWRTALKTMLKEGVSLGDDFSSEEKIDLFVDQLMEDCRRYGNRYTYSVTTAQRPA